MHEMGVNVAKAVQYKQETGNNMEYVGMEGLCPYCHSNLLRVDPDGSVYCPQCNVQGTVEVKDGKLSVSFTEEALTKSRWAPYGQDLHIENIAKGHKKAAIGSEEIKKNFTEKYKTVVEDYRISFPPIQK